MPFSSIHLPIFTRDTGINEINTDLYYSFDIVSPLRSAAAEVEMIEVVDKVIAEFRGGKSAPEDSGYEFYINHESGKFMLVSRGRNQSFEADFTVLSAILDLVPIAYRSRALLVFRMIGVDFSHEKAKEKVKQALKQIKGLPAPIINSLEACSIAGTSPQTTNMINIFDGGGERD